MPPSSRPRSATRRSPKRAALPREHFLAAQQPTRPFAAAVATVFGTLAAAEDGYLAWLLWASWYVVVPLAVALAGLSGAVLVWRGRGRGAALLVAACAVTLLGLLAVAVLFAFLGGGWAFVTALLLLVAPGVALVAALRSEVRRWTGPRSGDAPAPRRRKVARSG